MRLRFILTFREFLIVWGRCVSVPKEGEQPPFLNIIGTGSASMGNNVRLISSDGHASDNSPMTRSPMRTVCARARNSAMLPPTRQSAPCGQVKV